MDARFGFDDFQLIPTRLVATLPSLKVPLAVNLMVVPFSIRELAGLTVIAIRCAVEIVSPVDPLTEPSAALIVALPVATLDAKPWALMVAAEGLEEVQSTLALIFCEVESLKLPVAVYCLVVPTAMVEFAGITAIETRVAPVTVSDEVPLTEPDAAVMVVVPAAMPVASPVESTLATDGEVDDQVNNGNSWLLPSSKLPTALNCWVVPCAMD
jgi:hypothetical protein